MRTQRLTHKKTLCTIGSACEVQLFMNGKKYVTVINTPMFTQILTYKTEKEQYLDTFKRIKMMCGKKNAVYCEESYHMWKYWYYYIEER